MNLIDVKGIGDKTIGHLNNKGIFTLWDLVTFYPINYQYYNNDELIDKQNTIINGTVTRAVNEYKVKKNLLISSYFLSDGVQEYKIVAWNQKHLRFMINVGDTLEVSGVYDQKRNQILQKNMKKIDEINIDSSEKIIPVYSKITRIPNATINKLILNSLQYLENKKDKVNLLKVHSPKESSDISEGLEYLKYIEFYNYYKKLLKLKDDKLISSTKYNKNINESILNKFLYDLPFTLTEDQEKVTNNLIKSLNSNNRTQSLVLGDVGSGKTIVAIIITMLLINKGYQVAIMAPTEVLAKQLFINFKSFLGDIQLEFLSSSVKKSEKNKIKDRVLVGLSKVVIGTHSLIQEDVVFKNLALAIIDEQHRFGVEQRNKLIDKSIYGEYIYLSATPIPRTLAQSIFGVMDVQFIESKPKNRKKIFTEIFNTTTKKDMFEILNQELKMGHQAYVIAPTIEETEIENLDNVQHIYDNLKKYYENKYSVGLLHGNMKSNDKDKIMELYKEHKYDILVATTVIEVGVDVPNATVMMIVNAERYGLAQLHQLRGRVGRSIMQSYCLLLDKSNNDISKERLNLLKKYDNGFTLAKKDLKLRGSGNFFGKEQSGINEFKLFNYYEDFEIAKKVIKAIKDEGEQNE